jgi:hypothetical protein
MIPARIALWVAYGPTFLHSRDFLAVHVLCWELVKDTLSLLGTKYLEVRFSIFQPRTPRAQLTKGAYECLHIHPGAKQQSVLVSMSGTRRRKVLKFRLILLHGIESGSRMLIAGRQRAFQRGGGLSFHNVKKQLSGKVADRVFTVTRNRVLASYENRRRMRLFSTSFPCS